MTNSLGIGKDKGTLVSHDDVGLAGFKPLHVPF